MASAFTCVLTWSPATALSQSPAISALQQPSSAALEGFCGSARQSLLLDSLSQLWETTIPRVASEELPVLRALPNFAPDPIVGLACNELVAFAWTGSGVTFAWGLDANEEGLLGVPGTFHSAQPIQILANTHVISLAVGLTHAAAVDGER